MSKDEWPLLPYGLLAAVLILLILIPIQIHTLHFSRWAGRAILRGIVISVFVLYQIRRGQL